MIPSELFILLHYDLHKVLCDADIVKAFYLVLQLVSILVTARYMCQYKLFHVCAFCYLDNVFYCSMPVTFFIVFLKKRGVVNKEVCVLRQIFQAFACNSVARINYFFPLFNKSYIIQRHLLSFECSFSFFLQLLEYGPFFRKPKLFCLFLVYFYPVFLYKSVSNCRDCVLHRYRSYVKFRIVQQHCQFMPLKINVNAFYWKAANKISYIHYLWNKCCSFRPEYPYWRCTSLQVHCLHKPHQPCKMICMPVAYEYVIYSHEVQARGKYLALRAFAAVKQIYELVFALIPQIQRRVVALWSRDRKSTRL